MTVEEIHAILEGERPIVVVRCRDCDWYAPDGEGFGHCDRLYREFAETFYCAHGRRKSLQAGGEK